MTKMRKRTDDVRTAILLIHCPDRKGIVAAVANFLQKNSGNILRLDQHVDPQEQAFFMRLEWDMSGFAIPATNINENFRKLVADKFKMSWKLHFSDDTPRTAIFVSKLSHCLYDILSRVQSGEWNVEIPLIVSNHRALESVAKRFGVDYSFIPATPSNKALMERKQLELLRSHNIEFIVLARYMQILSGDFISNYPNRIINIHHSFLPAFPGAKPYHSASERGVKIIGATSHYVTADLDAGPIIEQDVVHVSHKDAVEAMIRKGQDLEKVVLSRAIWHHLNREILVYGNRTVVFT